MASETTGTIDIAAPAAQVVAVIADIANYPAWTDGMSDVTIVAHDESGRPSQARFTINGGPITDTVTLAYQWRDTSLSWTLVSGSTVTKLDGSYAWESTTAGTHVTYSLEVDLTLGLPGFIKRAGEKTIITTALQGLKKRVESA